MWLTYPTRTLITPCSQNNHCSWTSRLSPAQRAHHMQTVTYYNSSKTQQPRTTFCKTAREARTTFLSHRKHQSQSQSHAHQTHCHRKWRNWCMLEPNSSTPSLQAHRYQLKNRIAPHILFIIICRPPKYSIAFVEEFTELLYMISSEFDCFTVAGDFNIHIIQNKL